jgi:hypothetical protein
MSEIKPALTAEEWGGVRRGNGRFVVLTEVVGQSVSPRGVPVLEVGIRDLCYSCGIPSVAHAVAAVHLHGQPFGYTWEDVYALRWAADFATGTSLTTDYTRDKASALHHLADRIASLLPPRT